MVERVGPQELKRQENLKKGKKYFFYKPKNFLQTTGC
jgi:hypothetical protein